MKVADPVCPAQGSVPSFTVSETLLESNEKTITIADGTGLPGGFVANNSTLTTGRFVVQAKNDTTGFTFTKAFNGPTWITFDQTPSPGSAASLTEIATGNNINSFGPKSEAALEAKGIHVPTLALTSGQLVLHVIIPADGSQPFVDDLSLNGNLVDGCALLAAGR
jgi:hypothetical protein